MLKSLALVACLLLTACMVGPNFKEPKIRVAKGWVGEEKAIRKIPKQDAYWWNAFHDENLTYLINKGYQDNLSLRMTGVKVLQARSQLAQSVGGLYPQQQMGTGSYTYYRIGGGYLQDALPSTLSAVLLGVSANWELDFWGKYRRAVQSNDASFLSSLAAYDHALVTLTADIANVYVGIRTSQELISVTEQNIALQDMSLKITQSRFRAGQISMQDVEQAKTELAETQASLPTMVSQLQTQKDALAVLLGTTPNEVDALLSKKGGIPRAPVKVAVAIPRETLSKRPDVYQARMDAIAQSEAIGATKAELFPAFSLAGTFSFAANNINQSSLGDLFNWSNRSITAGPGFSWPLLNYGQITNSVRQQDAVFQQALLNYQNVVLKAQQEVQDNLTRYIEAKKTEKLLIKANRSAVATTRLTLIRYREGEVDYTSVVYAQQQQLRIQNSLVQAKGEVPKALIGLYRALGGGWQIRKGNDIVPCEVKKEMAKRTNWGDLLEKKNHQLPVSASEKIKQLYVPNW